MAIEKYLDKIPQIADDCFIAGASSVIGDVMIDSGSSVWHGAVIRGDVNFVKIGKNCSIQENSTIHEAPGFPTIIGDNVTIGHNAVVHACKIGNNCLIGMGAVILDGAEIGEGCIIGAGSVIVENKVIEAKSLVVGVPGKIIGKISDDRIEMLKNHALAYTELMKDYQK